MENRTNPAERGKRLSQARRMSGLSRAEIEEKYAIKAPSLKSWEAGRYTGLTEKGARRMSSVLKQEGIQCTVGWLMSGEGSPPTVIQTELPRGKNKKAFLNDPSLLPEIEFFKQHHLNAICVQITDDGMEPHYRIGDYVAGERYYQDAISQAMGHVCIVETQMEGVLIRLVRKGSREGLYNLQCLNVYTELPKPVLYDVELSSAAPIIWHRRVKST